MMDSADDILREMRMKYAEDLEEILECPVCFELPKETIPMCIQGHHICKNCMSMLMNLGEKCPTCQLSFSTCRNYVAENLCAKFEDIKSSILDPRHASNRRVLINKVSIQTQTEAACTCTIHPESSTCSVQIQTENPEEGTSSIQSVKMVNGESTNTDNVPEPALKVGKTSKKSKKNFKSV